MLEHSAKITFCTNISTSWKQIAIMALLWFGYSQCMLDFAF